MEFGLSLPKCPQFAGSIADDDWVYLAEAYNTGFEKVNVLTGEVIALKEFPGAAACFHMIKC